MSGKMRRVYDPHSAKWQLTVRLSYIMVNGEVVTDHSIENTIPSLETDVLTSEVFDLMRHGVTVGEHRKLYYIGEEGEAQRWCGPLLQVIKSGTYASISDGMLTVNQFVPIEDDDVVKFEKERQLAIRAGRKLERDFALIVAQNGCVLVESNAFCLMDMPAFIIEPGGDYYSIELGHRRVQLKSGGHIVIYSRQMPMVFITIPKRTKQEPSVEEPTAATAEHTDQPINAEDSSPESCETDHKTPQEGVGDTESPVTE